MKALVYPKDPNPYQELLYQPMQQYVDVKYLNYPTGSRTLNLFLLPFQIIYNRLLGFTIFHLHWSYSFVLPIKGTFWCLVSTIYYFWMLLLIRLLGYKLIWTVHNVLPHNQLFINDLLARRFLSRIASIKIVHSKYTIEEMSSLGLDINNVRVIPIGNYIGVYKNNINKAKARKLLNLGKNDFVFLYFGRIDSYKGVENLLKIFSKLNHSKIKLVIAGKCTNPRLQKILSFYKSFPNIIINDQFIPDKDIQLYFNAADIAVYPFEKVTTSSAVMLSLSFGIPVIYPNFGNLKDLPENVGYSYEPDDPNGLKKCLSKAIEKKENLKILSSNAFIYSKRLSWDKISAETVKVYSELFNLK